MTENVNKNRAMLQYISMHNGILMPSSKLFIVKMLWRININQYSSQVYAIISTRFVLIKGGEGESSKFISSGEKRLRSKSSKLCREIILSLREE